MTWCPLIWTGGGRDIYSLNSVERGIFIPSHNNVERKILIPSHNIFFLFFS